MSKRSSKNMNLLFKIAFIFLQELEPQVGEQLLQLWDHIPVVGKNTTD